MLRPRESFILFALFSGLFLGACSGGFSLRGSPSAGNSPDVSDNSPAKSAIPADILAKDKAMLDMTALAYAQKMQAEVSEKIGNSSVQIGHFEFSGIGELYGNLISGLESVDDKRTIREQLEDLGLDPEEREEHSDGDMEEVLAALDRDIFLSNTLSLHKKGLALTQAPSSSKNTTETPEELKKVQQTFGPAYETFKEKVGEVIDHLQEKKEDYDGVHFSAGCFSLMWQGEVCRSRSLYSTFHAFAGDAIFGFCFLNGSQQVSNPSSSGFRCLITY